MKIRSRAPAESGVLFKKWDGQAAAATLINCDVFSRARLTLPTWGIRTLTKMGNRILTRSKNV